MSYLLNAAYLLLLVFCSPWLLYSAVRKGKYRAGLAAKLLGNVPRRRGDRTCVWLHAVSVGEVNLLDTILAEIERRALDWECVISTTTRTGFALAQNKYAGRAVFYCPLDFSWAVRRAIRRVRPNVLVLAELELWPNLIRAAAEHGARVAIVNGRLSDGSFRGYRRIRPLVRWLLASVDSVAAQNDQCAERFAELGVPRERVLVTGSLKFDGATLDRDNPTTRRLARLAAVQADDIVFVAGSTQEPEEEFALATYQQLAAEHPRLRLLLVPRHPERFDAVAEMLDRRGVPFHRRSQLDNAPRGDADVRVLLVDTIGELGAWWGTAHIAFVGGSMGSRGGQNMIEPAAYGAAVSFGPNTRNFRDIVTMMLAARAAVVVNDGGELTEFVRRCLNGDDFAAALGRRARRLVSRQFGATAATVDLLERLVCRTADAQQQTTPAGRRHSRWHQVGPHSRPHGKPAESRK